MSRLQFWANVLSESFLLLHVYLTFVFGFLGLRRTVLFFLGNHIYRILYCPYSRQIEREWTIFPRHTEQRAVKQCQPIVSKYWKWRQVTLKCIRFSPSTFICQISTRQKGTIDYEMYFSSKQEISNTIKYINISYSIKIRIFSKLAICHGIF